MAKKPTQPKEKPGTPKDLPQKRELKTAPIIGIGASTTEGEQP